MALAALVARVVQRLPLLEPLAQILSLVRLPPWVAAMVLAVLAWAAMVVQVVGVGAKAAHLRVLEQRAKVTQVALVMVQMRRVAAVAQVP